MPDILDSIDWGTSVSGTSVTVYFAAAGEAFGGYTSLGWNAYEIGRTMAALGEYAAVSNLDFSISADSATATFKLVTVNSAAFGVPGVLGMFNPPGEPDAGIGIFSRDGLGWDMDATNGGLEEGGYGYTTLLHEFGHGLGLAHPHDEGGTSAVMEGVTAAFGSYGDFDLNQGVHTVMSYNSGWRLHPQGASPWTYYGWSGGLGALDIALIQEKYGARASNSGNNTYTLLTANGLGTFYQTLYDTGGTDTIVNPGSADSTISLVAATIDYSATGGGGISWVTGVQGGFTIAQSVVIENATGGGGHDTITGNSAANILSGGNGDDVLDGGAGADDLYGSAGDDTYKVDSGSDEVFETADAGIDTVETTLAYYNLGTNVERLIYVGSPAADFRGTGNPLDNYLQGGNGNDYLSGYGGADVLVGLGGNDTYLVDSEDDVVVEAAGAGTDYVQTLLTAYTLGANVEELGFFGDETGDETVDFTGTGNALDNVISGLLGDDTLDGAGGADSLIGGPGDDTYKVDHAHDITWEEASQGTDTVETALTVYILDPHIERLVYTGSPTEDLWFIGNAQDNVLAGASGDDQLDGLGGADRMQGFAGDDTYSVDNSLDVVIEAAGAGLDVVVATSAAYTLAANIEILAYRGPRTGDFTGTGNALSNLIEGWDGDDQLDGGAAADRMIGYLGDDTYRVDFGDEVVEGIAAGTDTVLAAIAAYTLGANVENLTYDGDPDTGFTGTGNSLANVIRGGNGDDTLDGGAGADQLYGGGGDDTYKVDNSLDQVDESFDAGTDRISTTLADYQLGTNVEQLVFSGAAATNFRGTGNDLDNLLQGGGGDDDLDGAGGADMMVGLGGNDRYVVDDDADEVIEQASAGSDYVYSLLTAYTLGANVEKLGFFGNPTDDFTGTGNALDNMISGRFGDDTLDGAGGADIMIGDAGDDTYKVDHDGDITSEEESAGTDTVETALASYSLDPHVERLVYAGTPAANFDGTGNGLANFLQGADGDDRLDGGAGADELAGLAGDDLYLVDHEDDEVIEAASGGTDTIYAGLSAFTLAANVENLFFAGNPTDDFTGTGNALANDLHGGDGDDLLDGAAGVDRMFGGAGDDSYRVDHDDDLTIEEASAGTDTVETALTVYALLDNVERLVFTGIAKDDFVGIGNGLDNFVQGAGGDDIIDGGAGADEMHGLAGNDTYTVDNSLDKVIEAADAGFDEVETILASYQLGANVEGVIYVGAPTVGFVGTGNALGNYLEGGGGNDTLDGAAGADEMVGGDGLDTYVVDTALDDVVELAAGGVGDRVRTALASYTLPDHVEILVGLSPDGQQLTGNALANAVYGGSGDDSLDGGLGHDKLGGGDGDDLLEGGAGSDLLEGGAGNDIYLIDSAADTITETLTTGSTADVARTSVSYVLRAGVRVEQLMTTAIAGTGPIDLTGNEFGNTITGNAGANILSGMGGRDRLIGDAGDDNLDGGAGDDTLDGGAGDDRYRIDSAADIIVETGTTGSDADIAKTTVSYVLGASVRVEMLMTTSSNGKTVIHLTGNEFANVINGNAAANLLKGMADNDVLRGYAGNDTLDGGDGDDTLDGGAGNDIFLLDSAADIIVETLTTGSTADVAKASVSYVLAAGVRVETLTTDSTAGTALIDLTGNEYANNVTGNAAANILKGMAGGDTLKGAAGDDDLQGGTGSDKIYGGPGNDLLRGDDSAASHGVDRFYFNTALDAASNLDTIADFNPADDFIHLARTIFTQAGAAGTLAADAFHVIGVGAADAQDRILYDKATGALFYDPDGTGAAAAIHFATVTAGLALANTDFIVF